METDHEPPRSPVVSVIVLSYNHAPTVSRALDSVLALTAQCPDMEIVLGDDGSTDGCYEICLDYARRYPHTVRLMPRQPNMGVVRNYFRCLKACRGEFVTDCAADDMRLPGSWLPRQIDMLKGNPQMVAVGSDWVERRNGADIASEDMVRHQQWRTAVSGRHMLLGVLASVGGFPVPLSCMLFRRREVDINSDMVCNPAFGCEDLPLVCALGSKGDFGFVPERSLLYIVDDTSVSNSSSATRLLAFYYNALVCRITLAPFYHAQTPPVNKAIAHGLRFVAGLAFDSGDARWRDKVMALLASWTGRVPFGVRLKMSCAANRHLWKLILRLLSKPR